MLVPTSGAYTGRFLLAFNFHLQYNYYLIAYFFLDFNKAGCLGKQIPLTLQLQTSSKKRQLLSVSLRDDHVIEEIIFYRSVLGLNVELSVAHLLFAVAPAFAESHAC